MTILVPLTPLSNVGPVPASNGTFLYSDWISQTTIGGYTPSQLSFPQVVDIETSQIIPQTFIPLYVKEHPVPIRKPKLTEVNTISNLDPGSMFETDIHALFFGSPELLQIQISGWLLTPVVSKVWQPTLDGTTNGTSLNLPGVNYGDLIGAYLEGRLLRNQGFNRRIDPAYYIDPYGRKYNNPKIAVWESGLATNQVKQTFSATLIFESGI